MKLKPQLKLMFIFEFFFAVNSGNRHSVSRWCYMTVIISTYHHMLFILLEIMSFVANIWKMAFWVQVWSLKPQKEVELGMVFLWATQPGLVISKLLTSRKMLVYQTGCHCDDSHRDRAGCFILLIIIINQIGVEMFKIFDKTQRRTSCNLELFRETELHNLI